MMVRQPLPGRECCAVRQAPRQIARASALLAAGAIAAAALPRAAPAMDYETFASRIRETGADSVEGFRKVLLGLLDPAERAVVDKRVRGNR